MQKEIYCWTEDILEMQTTKEIPSRFSKGWGEICSTRNSIAGFWLHSLKTLLWFLALAVYMCVHMCKSLCGWVFPDTRRRELSQTTCLWVKTSACLRLSLWSSGCDLTEPGRFVSRVLSTLEPECSKSDDMLPQFCISTHILIIKKAECVLSRLFKYKQNLATDPNY